MRVCDALPYISGVRFEGPAKRIGSVALPQIARLMITALAAS